MIRIVVEVDAPMATVAGVKENLAMYCERFGDVRVVQVVDVVPEQMRIEGYGQKQNMLPGYKAGLWKSEIIAYPTSNSV